MLQLISFSRKYLTMFSGKNLTIMVIWLTFDYGFWQKFWLWFLAKNWIWSSFSENPWNLVFVPLTLLKRLKHHFVISTSMKGYWYLFGISGKNRLIPIFCITKFVKNLRFYTSSPDFHIFQIYFFIWWNKKKYTWNIIYVQWILMFSKIFWCDFPVIKCNKLNMKIWRRGGIR